MTELGVLLGFYYGVKCLFLLTLSHYNLLMGFSHAPSSKIEPRQTDV